VLSRSRAFIAAALALGETWRDLALGETWRGSTRRSSSECSDKLTVQRRPARSRDRFAALFGGRLRPCANSPRFVSHNYAVLSRRVGRPPRFRCNVWPVAGAPRAQQMREHEVAELVGQRIYGLRNASPLPGGSAQVAQFRDCSRRGQAQ
jgi:hypothetical protein